MRAFAHRGLMLLLCVWALFASACAGSSVSDNGDAPDGDWSPADGDVELSPPDGDVERNDGDAPDGDAPLDGDRDAADGDADVDDAPGDGDVAEDGDLSDVDPPDGDASDGDVDEEAEVESECWVDPDSCSPGGAFDYTCTPGQPETCPGGLCVLGMCIGPILDPDRWADCGDGCCNPCETAESCPADCAGELPTTGQREYDNDTTLTIWAHGWSNTSADEATYGEERGCGGLLEDMRAFGVERPCQGEGAGSDSPQQMAKFEYFGDTPAAWLSADQIAEIEQYELGSEQVLHRYALIMAKYVRYKLDTTGATHVNLACHSYGCLITRYMVENNLEGLAAENRFVRWATNAGVLAGARLARLYDNTTVREVGEIIGIGAGDFVVMNPDFVMDNAAVWDHDLYAANHPYFKGVLIHNSCGVDPRIQEALNITLLDLNNPGDEPNDGIMYTLDTYFHRQNEGNRFVAADGTRLLPSHSYVYVDHMRVPETPSSVALAAAGLFHSRKVIIRLKQVSLKDDLEHTLGADQPPAEIALEHAVRYDPYLSETLGKDVLISESQYDHRTPEVMQLAEGQTVTTDRVIFSGPVFDDMESLWLKVTLLEVDWYPRFDILELVAGIGDKHDALGTFTGQVPLTNHTFDFENDKVRFTLEMQVVPLY